MDLVNLSDNPNNEDAFEAIFALNMGDFMAEHLISGELLDRINASILLDPDRLKKQLEELIQIYSLDKTLSLLGFQANQESVLYDSIAISLAEMFQVDACHIFQTTYKGDREHFLSLTGTSIHGISDTRWNIGYSLAETDLQVVAAYHDGVPTVLSKLERGTPGWKVLHPLSQERTRTVVAAPLHEGLHRLGLLMFESYQDLAVSPELLDLAEATAKVFVASIHLQRLLEQADRVVRDDQPNAGEMRSLRAQLTETIGDLGRYQEFFVVSLADAIDARNDYTHGHSQGVARIAKQVAEAMHLNEKTVDLVYYAGLLGSLGKIHVPQEILTKEESLTSDELETLKNSPNVGVGLLMKMNFLAEVIPYVDFQKERWDGKGSPNGLSGRSIPLGARIVGVADAYHALTHPRPYRETPMSHGEALRVLYSEAGTKWDPDVVASLAKISPASAS